MRKTAVLIILGLICFAGTGYGETNSITVAGFVNLGDRKDDSLNLVISKSLINLLWKVPGVLVTPFDSVAEVANEKSLWETNNFTEDAVLDLGLYFQAKTVLAGNYKVNKKKNTVLINVSAYDVKTGELSVKRKYEGSAGVDIFDTVDRMVLNITALILGKSITMAKLEAIMKSKDEAQSSSYSSASEAGVLLTASSAPAEIKPVIDPASMMTMKAGNKWGFIDKNDTIVIKPKYEDLGEFHEGLAKAKLDGKWGYIDPGDQAVIAHQYDSAGDFVDGKASVGANGVSLIIDKTGKVLEQILEDDVEDEAEWFPVANQLKTYDYLNKSGKKLVERQFENAFHFSGGLARVRVGLKYGYLDKTGKMVIEPVFREAWDFHNGLARIKVNGKYGFIDKTGKEVLAPQFEDVQDFHGGLAVLKLKWKRGYIDHTGKVVIETIYDDAGDFHEGLARVMKNWKWGFIDKTGKIIIPLQFDKVRDFNKGQAKAWQEYKQGTIDKTGKWTFVEEKRN